MKRYSVCCSIWIVNVCLYLLIMWNSAGQIPKIWTFLEERQTHGPVVVVELKDQRLEQRTDNMSIKRYALFLFPWPAFSLQTAANLLEWGQVQWYSFTEICRQKEPLSSSTELQWCERMLTNESWWMRKAIHSDEKKLHYTSSVNDVPERKTSDQLLLIAIRFMSIIREANVDYFSFISSNCCHVSFTFWLWLFGMLVMNCSNVLFYVY